MNVIAKAAAPEEVPPDRPKEGKCNRVSYTDRLLQLLPIEQPIITNYSSTSHSQTMNS